MTPEQIFELRKGKRRLPPEALRRHKRGQIVPTEHPQGLTMSQAWAQLFERNEIAEPPFRLNDRQIEDCMVRWFPSREKHLHEIGRVNRARYLYNRGHFTDGVIPAQISCRYEKFRHPDLIINGKRIKHAQAVYRVSTKGKMQEMIAVVLPKGETLQ